MPRNIITGGGNGKLFATKRRTILLEIETYIAKIETADNQLLESSTKNAIQNFILGCYTDGIWDSIKSCCIFGGARTLNGALTSLKGPNISNIGFISSDYNRATGLKNASNNKYLNTNYFFNANQSDNIHAGLVFTERSGGVQAAALGTRGTSSSSTLGLIFVSSVSSMTFALNSSVLGVNFGATILTHKLVGVKRDPDIYGISYFLSDGAINGVFNQNPLSIDTQNSVLVFATRSTTTGAITAPYNGRIFFYSVGTNIDFQKLNTRLNVLISAFSSLT